MSTIFPLKSRYKGEPEKRLQNAFKIAKPYCELLFCRFEVLQFITARFNVFFIYSEMVEVVLVLVVV